MPESFKVFSTGGIHPLKSCIQSSSNLALVMVILKSIDSAKESTSMLV